MKRALIGLGLLLLSASASAQQLVRDGEFVVHYAAMSTKDLSPAMAKQYGIRQSNSRGLLLVNLQRETAPGKTSPARGSASGTVRNLIGDQQKLALRPASDGSTQDLIAEFDIEHLEFLSFDVDVKPEGAKRSLKVKFQRQFFTDEN